MTRLPTELSGEIATLARDVTRPIAGFTLLPQDEILTRRGGADGLKIYQDLSRDGHTGSVLRKRRAAVVAREWTVEPGGTRPEDERAAALVRAALARIRFDRACQGLLSCVHLGMAVAEVIWEAAPLELALGEEAVESGTFLVPRDLRVRNAVRFRFDREEQLRLLTWEAPVDGVPLPERKFILARFWAEENEDPYGRGLGHDLFWPVFFKRNGIALWNALLERFGQPFVYAEYPAGTPPEERVKLLDALRDIARGAGLVVPQGSLVKLIEAGQAGASTGDAQSRLVQVMNAEISKIVLGETLTTEQGSNGSRAATQTHDDVRQELADADAALLSAELQPFLGWLTEINLPGAAVPTIHWKPPEVRDLAAEAKLDESLLKLGWEPTEERVREVYGTGYQRLRTPARRAAPAAPGAMPPSEPEADFAGDAGSDVPERVQPMLERLAEDPQRAIFEALRTEFEAASSFEDLDERLLRLSATLPVQPLALALGQAMALAALAGHAEVQDEADAAREA